MSCPTSSRTGRPEAKTEATERAKELRELAHYAKCEEAATLYCVLAQIRERDGVALARHGSNRGQFIDHFIDDFIDRVIV